MFFNEIVSFHNTEFFYALYFILKSNLIHAFVLQNSTCRTLNFVVWHDISLQKQIENNILPSLLKIIVYTGTESNGPLKGNVHGGLILVFL